MGNSKKATVGAFYFGLSVPTPASRLLFGVEHISGCSSSSEEESSSSDEELSDSEDVSSDDVSSEDSLSSSSSQGGLSSLLKKLT